MSGCTDCIELTQGDPGYNGWTFLLANIVDSTNLDANGDSRIVQQIIGYTGGTGPTPTQYINYYLTTTGVTTSISSATNIRGAKGAFNAAWISSTPTTYSNGTPPTNTIVADESTGTFNLTGVTGTSRIRYVQTGTTMILQFSIVGTMTIVDAVEVISLRFFVKIPNSKTASSVNDNGGCWFIPSAGDALNKNILQIAGIGVSVAGTGTTTEDPVYPSTIHPYVTDPTYLVTNNFILANASGESTGTFILKGEITFETTT